MTIPRTERVLNLMARLLASRTPVPIEVIRQEVIGYQDGEPEAVRKRFERDKRSLREMGVDIAVTPPRADDPGGYAIDRRCLVPKPMRLRPEELRLLALASRHCPADPGSALAANLQSALLKLSTGSDADAGEIPDGQLGRLGRRPGGRPEVHDAVAGALLEGEALEIDYQGRDAGSLTRRRVDPFGLGYVAGQWYLVGHCHLRADVRTFRLDRIVGRPRALPQAKLVAPPVGFRVEPYLQRHAWEIGAGGLARAVVAFDPDVYWHAKARLPPERCTDDSAGGGTVELDYADADRLLGWLEQFGRHARIVSPAELVDRRRGLRAEIARRHATPAGGMAAPGPSPEALPADRAAPGAGSSVARAADGASPVPLRRSKTAAGSGPTESARLARMLSLIPFLKRHQGIHVDELSNLSGIPAAELLEDLNAILMCGLPPYLPDDYIGVFVDDGVITMRWADHFALPVQLSLTEALALELALARVASGGEGEVVRSLRATVAEALPPGMAGSLSALALRIWVGAAAAPGVSGALLEAVARRVVLDAEYYSLSSGELARRRLHPLELAEHAGALYLTAYCERRGDVRSFNASRFRRATLTDEPFTWTGPVPRLTPNAAGTGAAERARVAFDAEVAGELADLFGADALERDPAGRVIVDMPLLSPRWFATWLASFGPRFEVLAPAALRARMARWEDDGPPAGTARDDG